MSGLRDVFLLVAVAGLVPASLFRPWIGVLGWSWIAYMAPHMLSWGFGRTLPVAALIGGATLLGLFITRDKKPLPRTLVVFLLGLFAVHFTATTVFALNPELAWVKWNWVSKSLLMAFVTMTLFQDRTRLRWLYMVMALSLGFYGVKGGLWALRTGGGELVWGPDGTFFGDNNTLGLALCMILPMLLYLAREEPRRWLKIVLRASFAITIVAILFTYSRGAFLGLLAIIVAVIWRSKWRWRFGATALLLYLVAMPLLPGKWWDRMHSITTDEQAMDNSARGRLEAWDTAFNIAVDRPFLGGGFRTLWDNNTWLRYHDGPYMVARDSHSLYFEVLAEQGFLGFSIYAAVLLCTLANLQRIRHRWRGHPTNGYLANYAEMTQLALCPYLVAGAFLGVAYFDLYFHLIATSVMLQTLSQAALTEQDQDVAAATSGQVPTSPLLVSRTQRRAAPALSPTKGAQNA